MANDPTSRVAFNLFFVPGFYCVLFLILLFLMPRIPYVKLIPEELFGVVIATISIVATGIVSQLIKRGKEEPTKETR
jgi:membrane protein implicated in regulation of membrane protease activity